MIEEDFVVTISDAREFHKGCIPGWKTFVETHGFDWKTVVRHGLKASELEATDDLMAIKLVDWVRNVRRKQ